MRRTATLLFTIILLVISLPLLTIRAEATSAYYNDWVYPGETFTVKEAIYTLAASSTTDKVLLQRGDEKYVIPYGECVLTRDGLSELCYEKSDYMDCIHKTYDCPTKEGEPDDWCCPYDVSHVKFDAGEARWGAYLTFTEHKPVVSVSHSAESTVLKLGESTDVTITFENSGEDTVTGAEYHEYIPSGFKVVPSADFSRRGNTLSLHFSLAPGAKKVYTYSIRPTEYLNEPITGNLSYTYKTLTESTSPSSLLVNVPSPFLITHTFEPATPALGEKSTYTYTLKNNDGSNEMDATVRFGGSLLDMVTTLPDELEKVNGVLTWSDTLAKGEEQTFTFKLLPTKTGTFLLSANATMLVNGEHFKFPLQDRLIITATKPEPEITFSNEKPKSGEKVTIRALLKNGETPYKNIQGMLNPGTHIFSLDRIEADENSLLGEITFTPEESETFTLTGSYETLYGERFNFSTSKKLTVDTSGRAYIITQEVNQTSAKPGDTLEVSVSVKNNQGRYADVTVTDVLPAGALLIAGSREQAMSLKDGEDRDAYTYRVTIPNSWEERSFSIVTRVYDHQASTTYEQQFNLSVTGIPERVVKNETQQQNTTATTPAPPKKVGFFRRIINALVDLMVQIFS